MIGGKTNFKGEDVATLIQMIEIWARIKVGIWNVRALGRKEEQLNRNVQRQKGMEDYKFVIYGVSVKAKNYRSGVTILVQYVEE